MKNYTRAVLLLLCLSLIAVPSHAAPVAVTAGWSWAEVYASVLEWFGLGATAEKAAPALPPDDPTTTTTSDGGGCVDPDGRPTFPCPIRP